MAVPSRLSELAARSCSGLRQENRSPQPNFSRTGAWAWAEGGQGGGQEGCHSGHANASAIPQVHLAAVPISEGQTEKRTEEAVDSHCHQ